MFRNGAFATFWGASKDDRDNVIVSLSTSRKNKDTDEYTTDFSNKFVRFHGEAGIKALKLKEKDRIKITECAVTNKYDKEKKTTYWTCWVYDFEDANAPGKSNAGSYDGDYDEDDDLPL